MAGGCDAGRGAQFVGQDYLRDSIETGRAVRLDRIIGPGMGTVCVLYPYQPFLAEQAPGHAQANEYLKSIRYQADEDHWALVLMRPSGVQLARFKRSERLDILSAHEVRSGTVPGLPAHFRASDCTDVRNGAFAKIALQGRQYVVLGELD